MEDQTLSPPMLGEGAPVAATAPKPASNLPVAAKDLETYAMEITTLFDEAKKLKEEAEERIISAGKLMVEARARCAIEHIDFFKWCKETFSIEKTQVYEYLKVGGSKDPEKALEDLRNKEAERKSEQRATISGTSRKTPKPVTKNAPIDRSGNADPFEVEERNEKKLEDSLIEIIKGAWHRSKDFRFSGTEVTFALPRRDFESICAHIGTPEVAKSALRLSQAA